ncbi:MAG: AMP-binding protein, partial [Variovorax sp.]
MSPSAQTDRYVHDRLPPSDQLPIFRYELPELQLPDQLNLVEELLDKAAAKGFADKPMLRSPGRTLSYAEAAVEVNRIAQVLTEDLRLVPGNRVLLRGGNSIAMALAWLAVVKAGLIAVATMPLLRAKELGEIIDKAQPTVALCEGKLLDELRTAQQAHPVLRTIVAFNQL